VSGFSRTLGFRAYASAPTVPSTASPDARDHRCQLVLGHHERRGDLQRDAAQERA
jgi:hypothetical protein